MSARTDPRPARDPADADAVRRRQLLLFSGRRGGACWSSLPCLARRMGGGKERAPEGGIEAEIAGPDAAEKVWTRRSEARLGGIETRIRELGQEARTLRADNDRLRARLEQRCGRCTERHRPPGGADRRAAGTACRRTAQPGDARPAAAPGSEDWFSGQCRRAGARIRRTGAAGSRPVSGTHDRELRARRRAPDGRRRQAAVFGGRSPDRSRAGGRTPWRSLSPSGCLRAPMPKPWCWPGVDASAGVS